MRRETFILLIFGVVFLLIISKALAWEDMALPSRTAVVKEDELLLNGQARKYLYCRSGLSYAEINDFFLRSLPEIGWRMTGTDCSERKGDVALKFTKGTNNLDIRLMNTHLEAGKNDFIVVIVDIKNEVGLAESPAGEGEDYPGKDIPSLPRYPKSQRMATIEKLSTKKINLAYQTIDSVDEVLDFYASKAGEYGWRIVKEVNFQDVKEQLDFLADSQRGLRGLEGGALMMDSPQATCMISVSEHPKQDTNSRIIGINYEEK